MVSPRPTFEYLVASRQELEATYQIQNNQVRESRRVREMERPAMEGCDARYILVNVDPRDPAVADESFRVQAANSLARPKLSLDHKESDTAAENATLREHFTEQTLWTIGTRGEGQDTPREIMDAALNDGGAWSKIIWSKDLWTGGYKLNKPKPTDEQAVADYNQKRADTFKSVGPPFYWLNSDVLNINPTFGPTGEIEEMLEVQFHPLHTALRKYRLGVDQGGNIVPDELGMPTNMDQIRNLPAELVRVEHWDQDWCTTAVLSTNYAGDVTGRIVNQFEHHYEFGLPYDFAPGLWMSHWKNRKVGWGIAQTKIFLVQYRSYLMAMHAQYVARDLLTPLYRQLPNESSPILGDDGTPIRREEGPDPGFIVNGLPGEQLQPIQYTPPTNLEKHIAMVDAAIDKLESPRVTTLEGLEGAGFAISQVLAFDLVRFGPITNAVETLLKRQTLKLWSLIKNNVRETVYVQAASVAQGYLGVGPDELAPPVGVDWNITPERATDELVRSRAAHERLQAGTLDEESVIEYLAGNDEAWRRSPDEVRRGKARDALRRTPWYQNWLQQAVAQAAGSGDLLEQAAQAEQAAMNGHLPGGPPNGQTPPAMGNGMVPDMGKLAMAPNGAGAALTNGTLGTGPGLVQPQNGLVGGAQPLTP